MFRVAWRVASGSIGTMRSSSVGLPLPQSNPFAGLPLLEQPAPVFPAAGRTLRNVTIGLPAPISADPVMDLAAYGQTFVQDRQTAEDLVARLQADAHIEWADLQAPWERPVVFSSPREPSENALPALPFGITPDFSSRQHYLDAAPDGIGARLAWQQRGGRGAGVRAIDIEAGWNFGHEDLLVASGGVLYGPNTDHDHGTAVLGIYSADHNGLGVQGIAPDARASAMAAAWDANGYRWNAAGAIFAAAQRLRPGDIILLEMHAPGPESTGYGQSGYVPVEYWDDDWAAIRFATLRGIHVVEAGGNGSVDLDKPIYTARMNRTDRDSGAILVGAGSSGLAGPARQPLSFTNFGSRVDVQGWGEHIVTTGGRMSWSYHDLWSDPDPSRCYTQSFGGTSGASPMIVGCVAVLEGIRRAAGKAPIPTAEMRSLLSTHGTPQTGTAHIGPLPDLVACLAHI